MFCSWPSLVQAPGVFLHFPCTWESGKVWETLWSILGSLPWCDDIWLLGAHRFLWEKREYLWQGNLWGWIVHCCTFSEAFTKLQPVKESPSTGPGTACFNLKLKLKHPIPRLRNCPWISCSWACRAVCHLGWEKCWHSPLGSPFCVPLAGAQMLPRAVPVLPVAGRMARSSEGTEEAMGWEVTRMLEGLQPCHLIAICPSGSYLAPLNLGFLVSKMGVMIRIVHKVIRTIQEVHICNVPRSELHIASVQIMQPWPSLIRRD